MLIRHEIKKNDEIRKSVDDMQSVTPVNVTGLMEFISLVFWPVFVIMTIVNFFIGLYHLAFDKHDHRE